MREKIGPVKIPSLAGAAPAASSGITAGVALQPIETGVCDCIPDQFTVLEKAEHSIDTHARTLNPENSSLTDTGRVYLVVFAGTCHRFARIFAESSAQISKRSSLEELSVHWKVEVPTNRLEKCTRLVGTAG